MRIGSAWTKETKDGSKPFISTSFDEAFLELCPQLKNCNIMFSYIDPKDRKTDKSPGWHINLIAAKKENSNTNQGTEQTAAGADNNAPIATDEEIPF